MPPLPCSCPLSVPALGAFLTRLAEMPGFGKVITKSIVSSYRMALNRGTWNREPSSLWEKYFHMSILVFVNVLELRERCGRC